MVRPPSSQVDAMTEDVAAQHGDDAGGHHNREPDSTQRADDGVSQGGPSRVERGYPGAISPRHGRLIWNDSLLPRRVLLFLRLGPGHFSTFEVFSYGGSVVAFVTVLASAC